MGDYAYYNGRYEKYSEISVPLTDRALFFGDGVYEVMLYKDEVIYQFDEHYERLIKSLSAIGLKQAPESRALRSVIYKLCDLSGYSMGIIYLQISASSERRAHERDSLASDNFLVSVSQYSGYEDKALTLITTKDDRHGICNVKSLNLLLSVLALNKARDTGCDGAVFVRDGIVTEESRSNVSILKNGELITHPKDNYILPGIMRSNLLRAAGDLGIPVIERGFSLSELYGADEVIISSTTKFVRRVSSIDGHEIKMRDSERFFSLKERLLLDFFDKCKA
jgi:D-alanine transaminase